MSNKEQIRKHRQFVAVAIGLGVLFFVSAAVVTPFALEWESRRSMMLPGLLAGFGLIACIAAGVKISNWRKQRN